MAGVIAYLRYIDPLWYLLEEWKDGEWVFLVRSDESHLQTALHADPGEEDRT